MSELNDATFTKWFFCVVLRGKCLGHLGRHLVFDTGY